MIFAIFVFIAWAILSFVLYAIGDEAVLSGLLGFGVCLFFVAGILSEYDYSDKIAEFNKVKTVYENNPNVDASFKLKILELNEWLKEAQKNNSNFILDDIISDEVDELKPIELVVR